MPRPIGPVRLAPERDVEETADGFVSLGTEPWLGLHDTAVGGLAGRLVEITYRLSFWDEPMRPVFRFWGDDGFVDRIGVGPIAGRGVWVGRIPRGTRRISVSPTQRAGRFGMSIDRLRHRRWLPLLAHGLRWHPRPARSAILTRLIGWAPESDVNLAWAIGSIPLAGFAAWRATHARDVDLRGLDRPRVDWTKAPPIRVVIRAEGAGPAAIAQTLRTLRDQVFPAWHAVIVGSVSTAPPDPTTRHLTLDEAAAATDEDLTCVVTAGDTLAPWALAVVAEQADRRPDGLLFYGDEIRRTTAGGVVPALLPGWSPRLQARRPYLGHGLVVRGLSAWSPEHRRLLLQSGELPPGVAATLERDAVVPLRRCLATTTTRPLPAVVEESLDTDGSARAAIIVPTRDHPALLERLVASIRARTRREGYRIVVVDNASVEPATKACLDRLRTAPDVDVIDYPGPFNFSAICNIAAAGVAAEVLVFLNDDMEVRSDGWLDRLVARALDPTIGAVGARLTYPDGRLQHIGVLAGMGESAGHFGALAVGDDPGWVGRNAVLHEVSAVTGACLAVSREKFDAVGGFDAADLPIELSDIDLCFKLNARGWQTVVDPQVHLMHEESASRGGATFRRLTVHDRERAVFIERWRHVLREDPFFHPGLSLYRWEPALG